MSSCELNLRSPSDAERELMEKMLSPAFPGKNALVSQMMDVRVRQIDAEGSLELVPAKNAPAATVEDRVPVEGEIPVNDGDDGVAVRVLLHVVDGFLKELEIYRDDLGPITAPLPLDDLSLIFDGERQPRT